MFTIMLIAAALKPSTTADRTAKAMKHRQSNGQRMTSARTVPFGRMVGPGQYRNEDSVPRRTRRRQRSSATQRKGHDVAKGNRKTDGADRGKDPFGSISEELTRTRVSWLISHSENGTCPVSSRSPASAGRFNCPSDGVYSTNE